MLIGILQTDSVDDRFQPQFGDYPQMFERLLGDAKPGELRFRVIDCRAMDYAAADVCDAYVITGSRSSVYDQEQWIASLVRFVQSLLDADRKLVGICFGHQLIAHYFGGRTAEVGWAVGVHRTEVLDTAAWMQPDLHEVGLLSSHKDQVVELPPGAQPILSTDFCPNSGFVIGEQVLTFQGHPEFSKTYSEVLMSMREELLGGSTFERGMQSLAQDTHEAEVAQWIVNFIAR